MKNKIQDSEFKIYKDFMNIALCLAKKGIGMTSPNPVVGAIIVRDGKIIGRGYHKKAGLAHAETNALIQAGAAAKNADMYVTLEPCVMCAGASFWTQIGTIVYGASDTKRGYSKIENALLHPKTEVRNGVLQDQCSLLLQDFFKKLR